MDLADSHRALARRSGPSAAGEPGQERLPGQHEPRAADPAQRHHRLRRDARGGGPRERARRRTCPDIESDRDSPGGTCWPSSTAVLDLSKIEAGKMELYIERLRPRRVPLQGIEDTILPLIHKNANVLEVTKGDNLGSMESDKAKVRQVLFNLLSNASKFTRDGIDLPWTSNGEWTLRRREDQICFRVRDSGIGMTPEQTEPSLRRVQSSRRDHGARLWRNGAGPRHHQTVLRNARGIDHVRKHAGLRFGVRGDPPSFCRSRLPRRPPNGHGDEHGTVDRAPCSSQRSAARRPGRPSLWSTTNQRPATPDQSFSPTGGVRRCRRGKRRAGDRTWPGKPGPMQ